MDDEELEQGGQGDANITGGRFNPATKVANGAQNVENAAKGVSKLANQSSKKLTQKAAQQAGQQSAKTMAKATSRKKMSETAAKVATKAGKVAKVAAKLAKIMSTVGVIIIILIAIIGILVFIITGFGFIIGGLKEIGAKLWKELNSWIVGEENIVEDSTIIDTLSYLEEMDYDLYGYGFVRKDNALVEEKNDEDDDEEDDETEVSKKKLAYDTDSGVYDYITAYLISDNYAYIIKNDNESFRQAFSSPGNFLSGLTGGLGWGSGLISIYRQKEDGEKITGERGEPYGITGLDQAVTTGSQIVATGAGAIAGGATIGGAIGTCIPIPIVGTAVGVAVGAAIGGFCGWFSSEVLVYVTHWDDKTSSIVINRDEKTMEIVGAGLFNNTMMSYNLDGWVGRYSMPLEFLLATHIATMAPDLSYKLATSFPTDIEILLYESEEAALSARVKQSDGTTIETKAFDEEDGFNFGGVFTGGDLNAKQCYEVMKNNKLHSIQDENSEYNCLGITSKELENDDWKIGEYITLKCNDDNKITKDQLKTTIEEKEGKIKGWIEDASGSYVWSEQAEQEVYDNLLKAIEDDNNESYDFDASGRDGYTFECGTEHDDGSATFILDATFELIQQWGLDAGAIDTWFRPTTLKLVVMSENERRKAMFRYKHK